MMFVIAAGFVAAPLAPAAGFPGLDQLGDLGRRAGEIADQGKKAGRVVKGATGLSLEEEVAIGDAVSLEIVNRFGGLWRNDDATRRVNLIGKVLGRYATRQDLDWRFGLLDSDTLNAFSAPGGRVFITRALYQMVRSDDELAGVLAHEIAHVDRRHALRIIARGELLGGVSELVADRNADFAQYEEVVDNIVDGLLTNGYDANTEFDADKRGRALARTTGFAAGGLRVVIESLQEREKKEPGKVFSTHPPAKERLKRLPKDPPPAAPATPPVI